MCCVAELTVSPAAATGHPDSTGPCHLVCQRQGDSVGYQQGE